MAVSTLVATAGASNANTYTTLVFANQYNEDRPQNGSEVWDDAGDDDKNASLLFATKQLDALYEWAGVVTTETQALLWPRSGMVYPSGYSIPTDEVPELLQCATSEYARQLLAEDRSADSEIEAKGLVGLKAGPVELRFSAGTAAKPVPDLVRNLLPSDWGTLKTSSMTARLVRA